MDGDACFLHRLVQRFLPLLLISVCSWDEVWMEPVSKFDWRALRDVDLRKVPARPNRLVERRGTTNQLRLLDAPAQVSGDALTAVWSRWNVCGSHENNRKGTLKWLFLCFSKASPGSYSRAVTLGMKRFIKLDLVSPSLVYFRDWTELTVKQHSNIQNETTNRNS